METEKRNDVISYGVGFKVFRTLGPFLRGEGSYWLKRSNPRYDFGKHTVENMM